MLNVASLHGLHSNGTNDFLSQQKISKIQYFFKKIFNSYVYVSVDNDTMKIQKEIEYVNSHIWEKIVKNPISHDQTLHFYSFVTIFSKLQTPQIL